LRGGLLVTAIAIGLLPTYRFIGSMIWFKEYLGDYQLFWGIGSAPVKSRLRPIWFPLSADRIDARAPIRAPAVLAVAVRLGPRRRSGHQPRNAKNLDANAIAIGFVYGCGAGVLLGGQVSLFIGALVIAGCRCSQSALARSSARRPLR